MPSQGNWTRSWVPRKNQAAWGPNKVCAVTCACSQPDVTLPPLGQGHRSVLSCLRHSSWLWQLPVAYVSPQDHRLPVMSHSAAGAPTGFASFVGSHQAHRCSLQMHKVRVSQQGHPVFFLDSLSCIVLALYGSQPQLPPGPDP